MGDFLSRGAHFSSPKKLTTFLVIAVVVKRQNSVVKIWQLIGAPLTAGAPPRVQPAQWIIRPCIQHHIIVVIISGSIIIRVTYHISG